MKRKILKRKSMFYPSPREALIWAVMFIGFYIVYSIGMQLFFRSDFFRVEHMEISGNHYLEPEDITESSGIEIQQALFRMSIEDVTSNLMENKYIRAANVARSLPATVRIDVRERVPVLYMIDKSIYMVDEAGVMLKRLPRMPVSNLPLVTGLTVAELDEDRTPLFQAIELVRKIREVDEKLLSLISEININKDRWPELYLVRGGAVVRLGNENLYQRLFILSEFLNKKPVADMLPTVQRIDLSFKDRIIVQKKVN
ncbi:MAG: FtsQ-type POTRA domain-containing protein [Calditrichota bacterium]